MSVGFRKSIAALLVGTGFAMAQSPSTGGVKAPTNGSPAKLAMPTRGSDISYPQSSTQLGYAGPLPAETPNGLAHHETEYGGVSFEGPAYNPYRAFFRSEFLLWNIRNPNLPSLVTSVPVGVVPITGTDTFINGDPATVQMVFSVPFTINSNPGIPNQESVDMGEHKGVRLTGGFWLDDAEDCGIEFSGFWLEKKRENFRATTANTTSQFNLDTGVQDRTFVVNIGDPPTLVSAANIVIPAQTNSDLNATISVELWGAEANMLVGGYRYGCLTFGALCGVRYIHFEEKFAAFNTVSVTDIPGATDGADAGVLPLTFQSTDFLRAQNDIIAPQIGLDAEARAYGCFLSGRAKVALGPNFQQVDVIGASSVSTPLRTSTNVGGLLSGPSDQGTRDRTRVSCVPELNFKLGKEVGHWLRMFVGYDALYLQHVTRTAQQTSFNSLSTSLSIASSTSQVSVQQPVIVLKDLDVWVQGINLGFELRY